MRQHYPELLKLIPLGDFLGIIRSLRDQLIAICINFRRHVHFTYAPPVSIESNAEMEYKNDRATIRPNSNQTVGFFRDYKNRDKTRFSFYPGINRAITMIHELGRAAAAKWGSGASKILDDAPAAWGRDRGLAKEEGTINSRNVAEACLGYNPPY